MKYTFDQPSEVIEFLTESEDYDPLILKVMGNITGRDYYDNPMKTPTLEELNLELIDEHNSVASIEEYHVTGNKVWVFQHTIWQNWFFAFKCDLSSWADDVSYGDWEFVQVMPVEKTITVYEEV